MRSSGLPSDITIEVEDKLFHLHKFPLISKCGKIAKLLENCKSDGKGINHISLPGFPGGPDAFEFAAMFCYGRKVEITPSNIGTVYCAGHFLEMADKYGEDNLQARAEAFLHKVVLPSWKNCILALRSCEPVLTKAEELQIIKKCTSALSVMACTDPSLFGWPMMMYGSLQSPGGSILWNGINTGARVRSSYSDWWYDDLTDLSLPIFERVMKAMEARGIRTKNRAGAIVHYAKRYLPGLSRRHNFEARGHRSLKVHHGPFSTLPEQKLLLETLEQLLPNQKGIVSCRILFALLRSAILLDASHICKDNLERRIGLQLELATLDGLLIPNYSGEVETLYDIDCVERIVGYFLSFDHQSMQSSSPLKEGDPPVESSEEEPLRIVAKLMDEYLTEIAPDTNLKPSRFLSIAETLPASSRSLHDTLYRAVDVYLKEHPWLSDSEKEQLCQLIDCQKLSMEACTHASQNERLPLRIVVQVLFFEQLQLRSAIAGVFQAADQNVDNLNLTDATVPPLTGPTLQRGGWAAVIRQNQVLKGNMDNIKTRVGDLEQEFSSIREEIERMTKLRGSFNSLSLVISKTIGCAPAKLNRQKSSLNSHSRSNIKNGPVNNNNKGTHRKQRSEHTYVQHSSHKRSFSLF